MKKKHKKLKVLFVCNKGGHLSEMLALRELFPYYDSVLLTEKLEKSLDIDIPVKQIAAFRTVRKKTLLSFAYFFCNIFQCLYLWLKLKPDVIITTGANMAVIICVIGKLFSSKIVFIETGAKIYSKSLTGKLISRFSDLIIVQWQEMLEQYKRAVYWGQIL